MAQNLFNFIRLLDLDGHSHGIYRWLDQTRLVFTSGYNDLVQDELLAPSVECSILTTIIMLGTIQTESNQKEVLPDFHLRLIVALHILRWEISQAGRCRECGLDGIQIRFQRTRLHTIIGELKIGFCQQNEQKLPHHSQ